MYYVIGSGPSGIATAAALISAGREVTVLDAGITLDPEREARRVRMAEYEPERWTPEDVRASRNVLGAGGQVAEKLCHGSAHPYQSTQGGTPVDYGELNARASFAKGGLSEVWGASVLPAVARILPVSGRRDDLVRFFPLPDGALEGPRESQQIRRLLTNMQRHRRQLALHGILFGSSRLAARFVNGASTGSCNYCGHCDLPAFVGPDFA